MTHLPEITGRKLIKILKRIDWMVKSQKGSHVKMTKEGCRHFLIVPVHSRKTIPKGTLLSIIKDAGLTVDEFLRLK